MYTLLLAVIYIAFISLGLPDSLLGAAWPQMHVQMQVPIGWAGAVSATISLCTITSSLLSERMIRRFGTGRVTAFSTGLSALALLGFSVTRQYWMLFLWAVPYGLGAGGVDAALNNYVALHYSSRHMSWLHCMWGLGASVGPYILGYALSGGGHWSAGYRYIGVGQVVLSVALFLALPMWKGERAAAAEKRSQPMTLRRIFAIPGAKEVLITFFCYCALESTSILWASSYLALHKGMDAESAARYASLFFIGITAGRALSGFLTARFNDTALIRIGQGIIAMGLGCMLLPLGDAVCLAGILLAGLGCAPIYPCIMHSTPEHFGPENSQAVVGLQMAFAYLGSLAVPPLFGMLAQGFGSALLPWFLLVLLAAQMLCHERLLGKVQ